MKIRRQIGILWLMSLSFLLGAGGLPCNDLAAKSQNRSQQAALEILWQPYTDGLAQASKTKKPAFIDFYTEWCHWCHELDRTTYKDARVIRLLNEKFVSIKVDAESKKGSVYAGRYPIRGYPSLWFVAPSGEIILPIQGYVAADNLMPVLVFIGDGHYPKMTYDEFMKSLWPKIKAEF
jgi:thioredoxin-related protein